MFSGTDQNQGVVYGFGRFDIASPAGSPGAYSYASQMLRNPAAPQLSNLAMNPVTGEMVLSYGFTGFRSISTSGSLSDNLGTTATLYGMAYDASSQLYAYTTSGPDPVWLRLDPADGQTLTSGSLSPSVFMYSSLGGNLTGKAGGGFLYADEMSGKRLYQLAPSGANALLTLSGSFSGGSFDPNVFGTVMFTNGSLTYLLRGTSLFEVDVASGALTELGGISGLPAGFKQFTGAAAPITPVPEPASWSAAVLGLAGGAWLVGRVRPDGKRRS
ncbi:MAG: hypothetical protein ACKO4T_07680 [Planctomycetaceae bacterium]